MEKIKNLSLKSTIILYMAILLILGTILNIGLVRWAKKTQETIWFKYIDIDAYNESVESESGSNYITQVPRIKSSYMKSHEVRIVELCDAIETWSDLVVSFIGCIIVVFLFYRNKLKTPLKMLSEASQRISANDLDFEITYDKSDEMGVLCGDFEKMRSELSGHKKKMWKMMEDEKILRSTIAHDIRTPITVIKGNLEIIEEFLPQNKISDEKALQFVGGTINHVERLEHFIDVIKQINSLVDIEAEYKKTTYLELVEKMREIQERLCTKEKISHAFSCEERDDEIKVDSMIVMEVEENLISNALRYAKEKIKVSLEIKQDYLYLMVEDDGKGFQESPQKLLQAYYKSREESGDIHYGLGLYISKILCENHQGELVLKNSQDGGALAIAKFKLIHP